MCLCLDKDLIVEKAENGSEEELTNKWNKVDHSFFEEAFSTTVNKQQLEIKIFGEMSAQSLRSLHC